MRLVKAADHQRRVRAAPPLPAAMASFPLSSHGTPRDRLWKRSLGWEVPIRGPGVVFSAPPSGPNVSLGPRRASPEVRCASALLKGTHLPWVSGHSGTSPQELHGVCGQRAGFEPQLTRTLQRQHPFSKVQTAHL